MKIMTLAVLAVFSIAIFGGCTSTGSSSSMRREIDSLKAEVASLKDSGRLSDMRGGGGNEISTLRSEIQRLSENVDSAGTGGLSLKQQIDYLNARLDRLERSAGLQSMEPRPSTETPSYSTGGTSGRNNTTGAGTYQGAAPGGSYAGATTPATGSSGTLPPPAQGPYEKGKSFYDKKQYREAIAQFKSYLESEPKGNNAAAAQFYIGEALYSQKQYEEAILEYQKVVQSFPKSSQVPTSILKQGISFNSMGDKDSAKLLYQKVVRDYPKSYAAGVAKERLKSI